MTTRSVLVVDDEKPIQEAVRLCLEMMGSYKVLTAGAGQEGLRIAETEQPDAILLDMWMADMDGLTTLRNLRKNAATQAIPVILLTAETETSVLKSLGAEEFTGVLTKPFAPAQFAAQVAQILGWSD